jgi:trehalose-6-phosphatase
MVELILFRNGQSYAKCSARTLAAIRKLAETDNVTVLIITMRGKNICDAIFGDSPAWIAAENGCYLKRGAKSAWETILVKSVPI